MINLYICEKIKFIKSVRPYLILLWWMYSIIGFAQGNVLSDARTSALGYASVSLQSIDNPSANSFFNKSSISVHYQNPFAVKELTTVAAHLFIANRFLDAAVVVSHFGFEKYNENQVALQVSKRLSSQISVGVRVRYLSLLMAETENRKSVISSDIGFIYSPIRKLVIGFSADNIVSTPYSTARGEYKSSPILRIGANYSVTKELILVGELMSDSKSETVGKAGIEYLPVDQFALRIGAKSSPFCPTFGAGYSPSHFSFDVASLYHAVLGFHTQFSMKYSF